VVIIDDDLVEAAMERAVKHRTETQESQCAQFRSCIVVVGLVCGLLMFGCLRLHGREL